MSTLIAVPLFHVTGCNTPADPAARRRRTSGDAQLTRSTSMASSRPSASIGVTGIVAVPAIYHALLRSPRFAELDVSHVRRVSYGGAPIAAGLVSEIQAAFPELARWQRLRPHRVLRARDLPSARGGRGPRRLGRIRRARRRSRDRGRRPGHGRRRAAGPRSNVAAGYWNDPQATRRGLRRGLAAHRRRRPRGSRRPPLRPRSQEGHDQPRRRECLLARGRERAGRRARDRRGGGPRRARRDDGREGRGGDRAAAGAQLDVGSVLAHCEGRLADYKVPQYIVVRDRPLPRSSVGKVLKRALREQTSWGAARR